MAPTVEQIVTENGKNDEVSAKDCETCQMLREHSHPFVDYVNVSQSDVIYDRTLFICKLDNQPSSSNLEVGESAVIKFIKRKVDRFEESKLWELIGLTPRFYEKLPAVLKKISPDKLVFNKCVYRLHNTRHFTVPLKKKGVKKQDVWKQEYEDDRKLVKRNQAFDCPWQECMHSFRDPQDMRIHYMFDHESVKLFCCQNKFDNYERFLEHYVEDAENGKEHYTWMARECWGCGQRFIDEFDFHNHTNTCQSQLNPYKCPDPLCMIRFEYLCDSVEHFFLWHDPCASLICNDVRYFTLDAINKELPLLDDGQLVLSYPVKASYLCSFCKVEFSAEKYFLEHVKTHAKKPHLWLSRSLMFCEKCSLTSCPVQLNQLIRLIPKLIQLANDPEISKFRTHPMLLIWRLYLTKEFVQAMEHILMILLDEHSKLPEASASEPEHEPVNDKRLAKILDTLFYMYTVDQKTDDDLAWKIQSLCAD